MLLALDPLFLSGFFLQGMFRRCYGAVWARSVGSDTGRTFVYYGFRGLVSWYTFLPHSSFFSFLGLHHGPEDLDQNMIT